MPGETFFRCATYQERLSFHDCLSQQFVAEVNRAHYQGVTDLIRTCIGCGQGKKIREALRLLPILKNATDTVRRAYLEELWIKFK